eukprot:CAMPEP_0178987812 /NCGR_PEP_ID=MMETSP0795-20121207/3475_1 /TAXON_ID=88552 /ORGANISM="Amoebophrya sp., Strain Ameob2" /LENGTH=388 /DNA_ID=CAMNT_0020679041 /DNA_START=93 /DNA_END=1259 /DNA_ORIENTATION=+
MEKAPSQQSLYELLRIATPSLTIEGCADESARDKAFKALKFSIHPDKHSHEKDNVGKATKIFQRLENFFDAAVKAAAEPPAKKMKVDKLPSQFNCFKKWNYLDGRGYKNGFNNSQTARLAVNSANIRAQISHGGNLETKFLYTKEKPWAGRVEKLLNPEPWILKKQITEGGPVVSNSFRPSKNFVDKNSTIMGLVAGETFPVMITGWDETGSGAEVWTICVKQELNKNASSSSSETKKVYTWTTTNPVHVALHQFNILGSISYIPQRALSDVSWRAPEPYVEYDGFMAFLGEFNGATVSGSYTGIIRDISADSKLHHQLMAVVASPAKDDTTENQQKQNRTILTVLQNKAAIFNLHAPGRRSFSERYYLKDLEYDPRSKKLSAYCRCD